MYLLRPLEPRDLRSLERFALKASAGITNLPQDREFLQRRIDLSEESFSKRLEAPDDEYYGFALEEVESGETVGTCGIFSKIGVGDPHYCYTIQSRTHHSESLRKNWDEELLTPTHYHNGPTEICSLYLLQKVRSKGVGRLLSLSRFLLMADFPERFDRNIVAEMRGVSAGCSDCPFWDAVGRNFLNVEFCDVVKMYISDKRFVPDFLPDFPIHIDLLPQEAKEVIGKPHPHTAPAMKLLEKEGFAFNGEVDIFDAGPTISAPLADVRAVRESRKMAVGKIIKEEPDSERMLVSTPSLSFRATYGHVTHNEESCTISQAVASLLEVKEGDFVRWAPAYAPKEGA